jgi:glycogen(starch) synthase
MRVLLTTDTVGGVWTFTRELARELLRRGHAVALVSFGRLPSAYQRDWCKRMEREFTSFECEASEAPLEWMSDNERSYGEGLCAISHVAGRFCPDVVHSSQFCFGALPFGVPVVVTAHSDVMSWGAACRPSGMEMSPWLIRYRELVERGLAGSAAIAAPTSWMLEALCKNFAFREKGRVIPNGVGPYQPGSKKRQMRAVSAGRFWDEGKNLSLLTKVANAVPIVVAGEWEYAGEKVSMQTGGVRTLGVLNEETLLALFQENALYIAPSIYEPFGLAPLEAAQCGCVLLLHDIPSFREVWGESAIYFKSAAGLQKLLEDIARGDIDLVDARIKVSKRAQQMTAGRMADAYVELYSEVTQRPVMGDIDQGVYVG